MLTQWQLRAISVIEDKNDIRMNKNRECMTNTEYNYQ